MAHSESLIRKAVKILLEEYIQLDTSSVKKHLDEVLVFDKDDKKPSKTRKGEIKILQRIGNVVSHQKETVHYYEEGYAIDKSVEPAVWFVTSPQDNSENRNVKNYFRKEETNTKKQKTKKHRKIDWKRINERNTALGKAGELFVFQNEIDEVMAINPSLVKRIVHLSEQQGDGFGYDILSIDKKMKSVYIEVKTTTEGQDSPFYMSINELDFFKSHKNKNAFIYRVYDFNLKDGTGKILKISAENLLTNYKFDPISYLVTKK